MKLRIRYGLPFITCWLEQHGRRIQLDNVLLDTGSAASIFSADMVLVIGLKLEPDDEVRRVRGVGGSEFVFQKVVDRVQAGPLLAEEFAIQVGAMDYGFNIDGILGMDFLKHTGAIVDLATLELRSSETSV